MKNFSPQSNKTAAFFALGAFLVTVAVITDISYDPVNLPKLVLLSMFGFCSFFITEKMGKANKIQNNKFYYVILFIPLWMFFSSINSDSPFELSFWGEYARNTGLLAYLCLALYFLAIVNFDSKVILRTMLYAFFFSGLFNALYGSMVFFIGKDPIPWSNPFAPAILGTFGNPNFVGAFMGMFGGFVISYLLFCKPSRLYFTLGLFLEIFVVISIYASRATQGYLVFGLTTSFVLYFKLRQAFSAKLIANLYAFGLLGAVAIVLMGILNMGPLNSLLYKDSITFRGQYWTAGLNMANSSPLFGLGPDSYGTWYRQFRDPSALISPGVNTTTNAAHNVFIDFLVNGGYPVLISYIAMILFVLFKALRRLMGSRDVDFALLAFTTIWIGYLVQSLFSINQLGLAIWGWVAPACILVSLRQEPAETNYKKAGGKQKQKLTQSLGLYATIGLMIGGLLSLPMLVAEKNWRDSLEIGSLPKIEKAINAFPRGTNRYILGVKILTNNKLDSQALRYVKELNTFDPNNFAGWDYLMNVRLSSESDKKRALSELKRLDPNREFNTGD